MHIAGGVIIAEFLLKSDIILLNHPFSINFNWQVGCNQLGVSKQLAPFLLDTGSLTALLKQHYLEFRVEVLNEQPVQQQLLTSTAQDYVCREVLLHCDGQPRVYAQSWICRAAVRFGVEQLGETPLGEVLFQDNRWQRSEIEVAKVTNNQSLAQLLGDESLLDAQLFARRRIFSNQEAHVMVCEVFLPGTFNATSKP